MSSASSILASYAFNALWQIPFLALMGWLICRTLKRLGPAVEHHVWVAVLFLSIALPATRGFRLSGVQHASSAAAFVSIRFLAFEPSHSLQHGSLVLSPVIITAVSSLYVAVLLFFLLRFATSVVSAVRLLKRSKPVLLGTEFSEIWDDLNHLFHTSATRVLASSAISGPVTLALRGPVLLLPEDFAERTSARDFRAALAHECAHIQRNDFLKNTFYEGVSLFIAFHPVSWLIKAQLAQTREMTCDALAMKAAGGSRAYIQSLLRLASAIASCPTAPNSHAIGIFDANILEKRIMTLTAKKETTSAPMRYSLMFVGSLCLLLAVAGGTTAAVGLSPEGARDTASTQPADQIYKIGKDVSAPKLLRAPKPEYPKSSPERKEPFKGICLIGLVVDASGNPREVHVIRSLGKDFDENAIKAVEQYQFSPAMRSGSPVSVALSVEVNFQKF